MEPSDSVLKDFLMDSGLVSRTQIDAAARGGKPLSRALIDGGILSEDEMRRAAAHALGVPFVVLEKADISIEALMKLPEPLCRSHNLAAYATDGHTLEVALLDLADLAALEPLRPALKERLVPRLTTRDSVRRALLIYQKALKEEYGDKLLRERDPARALEVLLKHAVGQHASEVHLDSGNKGLLVRYRIGNQLEEAMRLPPALSGLVDTIRNRASTGSKSLPQEGRFGIDLGLGEQLLVRVSSVPIHGGSRLVLRLVHERAGSRGFTLEGLGLHGKGAEALRAALHRGAGIVLVAGTHGAGRTALLYTLLDLKNAPHLSLASVEGMVRTRLPYVAQTEANAEAGLSMAAALRASLRQDPDIVAIDSVEDRETLALATAAASRGLLVLLGVESPDIAAALGKLRALGMADGDLGLMSAAVAAGSVRRLCQKQTRATHPLERRHLVPLEPMADFARVLAALKEEELVPKDLTWKEVGYPQVTGCSECDRGYDGEIGVYEVIAGGEGLLGLVEDALYKAAAGLTSIAEVLRFAEAHSAMAEGE